MSLNASVNFLPDTVVVTADAVYIIPPPFAVDLGSSDGSSTTQTFDSLEDWRRQAPPQVATTTTTTVAATEQVDDLSSRAVERLRVLQARVQARRTQQEHGTGADNAS